MEAWTLAEILRQGGGAESLSDDLRFACSSPGATTTPPASSRAYPELRRIPTPRDPTRPGRPSVDSRSWNGSIGPSPQPTAVAGEADSSRPGHRLHHPATLRLSSPRVETLEEAEEKLRRLLGARPAR